MTTLELRLQPAAAKVFKYYHDTLIEKQPRMTGLFRQLIIMTAEPLWDNDEGAYKTNNDYGEFTEIITVQICQQVKEHSIDFRSQVFIPPHKMRWINSFVIEMLEMDINDTVDRFLDSGKMVKDAIHYVFDKFDIDEESEYKFERALQMNLRYRRKMNKVIKAE